jgi:ubiquinone/menaquinone biosynthesis C-methylase UbiE
MESAEKTRDWYKNYYNKKGKDRNDLISNSEVLYQYMAFEDSVYSALRKVTNLNRESSKILDVGCGGGASLARFLQLEFSPNNLYGIDIIKERIDEVRRKFPNINLICDDASSLPFDSNMFDLTMESTMFVQITDEVLSKKISEEMLRVTKLGGYILIVDWRYGKPRDSSYLAVSLRRIKRMFSVGSLSSIICIRNGALIPPIGRTVSKYLPSIYFPLRAIFPFLIGSRSVLLRKQNG